MTLPFIDRLSGCVKQGVVPPLKLCVSGDRSSFLIFLVGHLIYGAVTGALYDMWAA